MDNKLIIKLFIAKNVKGFYYITTSQPNICGDYDFAKITKNAKKYQMILKIVFNGQYSNTTGEIYFLKKEDADMAMKWINLMCVFNKTVK